MYLKNYFIKLFVVFLKALAVSVNHIAKLKTKIRMVKFLIIYFCIIYIHIHVHIHMYVIEK